MQNFIYYAPTEVVFGRDAESQAASMIRKYGGTKVLLHYGGQSAVKSGLLARVEACLDAAGIAYVKLGGVRPNPRLSLVREGIEICRREGIDFLLAVGGGSVIDSCKAISSGMYLDGDVWDLFLRKAEASRFLPIGCVLTIPAAGSEMSGGSVITNEDGWLKRGFGSDANRPLFSILNPELTYTVSKFQTGCGIVDIMMHTLERYFCLGGDVALTDHLAEGLLKSVIEAGRIAIEKPDDYEARATLMWAGSLSHNGLTGDGRKYFMRCHQLEHELSGMYDRVAHGAGLAVVFPAWARYIYRHALPRFCQYATRVWGVEMDHEHPERTALAGIRMTEEYFASIGMPTRLGQLDIDDSKFEEMAEKCTFFGKRTLPDYVTLDKKEIIDIFKLMV